MFLLILTVFALGLGLAIAAGLDEEPPVARAVIGTATAMVVWSLAAAVGSWFFGVGG